MKSEPEHKFVEVCTPDFWRRQVRERSWPPVASGALPLKVADLFSGCGGLTMGAVLAARALGKSLRVELAVDNWQAALNVYEKNFGQYVEQVICGDIKGSLKWSGAQLDVVLAGPPCQGHSDLNNSTRRFDDRNELYLVPISFAKKSRAKLVLVENVPTVVHATQNVIRRARRRLQSSGYSVAELVIDVSNLGIPQKRRRHLLVGSLLHGQERLEEVVNRINNYQASPAVLDFIADLQDEQIPSTRISAENEKRIRYLFKHDAYDLPNRLRPPCHKDKAHSYGSMYGRIRPDRPAQTITSGFGSMGQGRYVHPTRPRLISTHEAARIQGFPDYFDFSMAGGITATRQMIANAVPPAASAVLLTELLRDDQVLSAREFTRS